VHVKFYFTKIDVVLSEILAGQNVSNDGGVKWMTVLYACNLNDIEPDVRTINYLWYRSLTDSSSVSRRSAMRGEREWKLGFNAD